MMKKNFSNQNLLTVLGNGSGLIFLVSTLIIIFATLLPFNFVFPDSLSLEFIIDRFTKHSSWQDFFENLLLFLPFGFSLATLLDRNQLSRSSTIIIVAILSLFLSSSVELLQVFLPSRAPTSVDLFSNSLSGFLGSLIFYGIRNTLKQTPATFLISLYQWFKPLLSLPGLTLVLTGYVITVCLLLWNVQTVTQLNNWDESFPLIIGNELTEDRAWEGQISQVCISNQAASTTQVAQLLSEGNSCEPIADSLIADYEFTELQNNYSDKTGNLPDLEWIDTPSEEVNDRGIFLGENHALKTREPVQPLTEKIQQTSEFTLSTQFTTSNLTQDGPARIITISQDRATRNFLLGQTGSELRVRVRNPMTGKNGLEPEIQIFDVFSEPKTHHIVITYTGSDFNIYQDTIDNSFLLKFTPEAALFWSMFSLLAEKMPLNPTNHYLYFFLYHGLIFIPLGIIVTIISWIVRGDFIFYLLLIFGGVVVPALLVEGVLASSLNGVWSWKSVGLNIAITVMTWIVLRLSVGWGFKSN